jgi:hypothetical protein
LLLLYVAEALMPGLMAEERLQRELISHRPELLFLDIAGAS